MTQRITTIVLFLLLPLYALSQEGKNEFGKYKVNNNFCLHTELGWNRSWFASLGASYVFSSVNSHTPLSFVAYFSVDANIRSYGSKTPFYAYKAGFEVGNLILAYGAEFRNNTDFAGNDHFIFMPKAGLNFYGHVSLMYGYNVFRTANNIFGINHSQITLNVNLNRKIFKESLVPSNP